MPLVKPLDEAALLYRVSEAAKHRTYIPGLALVVYKLVIKQKT